METDVISVGEAYLEHFGIKGMKWGQRKDRSSGSSGSSQPKKKLITRKRVAVGLAVAAGTLYVGAVLAGRGSTKVPKIGSISSVSSSRIPSPHELRIQAGMAQQRNILGRIGNQRLTDKTWRDAAQMSRMARFSAGRKSVSDLEDVNSRMMSWTNESLTKAWNDPNHVWHI